MLKQYCIENQVNRLLYSTLVHGLENYSFRLTLFVQVYSILWLVLFTIILPQ
jgi:hypothetical protein